MSERPRVVLGMPAYNRPDAMPRALDTLLSQVRSKLAGRPQPDDLTLLTAKLLARGAPGQIQRGEKIRRKQEN